MQLHDIHPSHTFRPKKRIGRGGKRGTTSGKGQKGQKSRAGHNIRPAVRDVIIRTPKKRGYHNKRKSLHSTTLTLSALSQLSLSNITPATLFAQGIISSTKESVKIVATGAMTKAVSIEGISVSAQARTAIIKAGGSIAA